MAKSILALSGIYAITNTSNDKKYIGSSDTIKRRWKVHVRLLECGQHHSAKLQNSWKKNGSDCFEVVVLEVVTNFSELIVSEQKWIDHFESASKFGYNMNPTAGTCKGLKRSDSAKKNMSVSGKLRCSDPETKAKMLLHLHSAIAKENQRKAVFGVSVPKERRKKISEALIGSSISIDRRAKISATLVGRKHSSEQIEKMKAAQALPEVRQKMRLAHLGKKLSQKSILKRTATLKANRAAKKLTFLVE